MRRDRREERPICPPAPWPSAIPIHQSRRSQPASAGGRHKRPLCRRPGTGQAPMETAHLIGPTILRFMATDRGFRRARRAARNSEEPS
ncbi:MAG: DUF2274 domain-containing protein [Inquilinus sp.]|uniref:DUF2274 domain-containing protein n=1 Tax=Inquilinus sp. TaxID=1932117 RepID=UPI003F3ACFE9